MSKILEQQDDARIRKQVAITRLNNCFKSVTEKLDLALFILTNTNKPKEAQNEK